MYVDNGGKVICVYYIECYIFLQIEWLLISEFFFVQ